MSKKDESIKSLSVKLSNLTETEQVLLTKWIENLKAQKKSVNGELQKILFQYLTENNSQELFKEFQTSIFYAFRKSIFASLSPYHSNIKYWINLQNIELEAINKKLDIILNLLALSGNLNLNSPKEEYTRELDYFIRLRNEKITKLMTDKQEEDDSNKQVLKTFENFQKVAFDTDKDIAERIKKAKEK
ncbi:Mbov_0398 family ICE element protein [Mycoplasmopsis glycophila]|uniref:ICEF Integrative Conjugal Element-II n=1 Tax=Mycoplasmopsis glycophila TaxID=171285 RepID=A0A449AV35_9BACT|nr:hypothetical protein [Mycoplasmopsis glycophila]VEU70348.1 Uncharacterised protein [Mycoplasmopsis glycophila]VEU70620.1 Uncharacterised protein [Mycoplasmopsis glycophila]